MAGFGLRSRVPGRRGKRRVVVPGGRVTAILTLALCALILSGCARAGAATEILDDDDATTTGSNRFQIDLSTDSPYWLITAPGPLDEFLVRMGMSVAGMNQQEMFQWQARNRLLAEEYVAACMLEQGFSYYPGLWSDGVPVHDLSRLTARPGTREWAETYGLSASGWVEIQEWWFEPGENPNYAVVHALSASHQDAYWKALLGPGVLDFREWPGWEEIGLLTWFETNGQSPFTIHPSGGCRFDAMVGGWRSAISEEFASLRHEVNNFHLAVEGDSRIAALNQEWASCMAVAGHSGFTAPGIPLWGAVSSEGPTLLWQSDPTRSSSTPYRGWLEEGDRLTPESEIAWAQFREFEKSVAVADWDCRFELDYDAAHRAIELELQQEFVNRLGPELEAWAQYEEARQSR